MNAHARRARPLDDGSPERQRWRAHCPTCGKAAAAVTLILLSSMPTGSSAQPVGQREPLAVSASLGRHGLGAGVEVPVIGRVAVAARGEWLLPTRYKAAGVGGRIDFVSDEQARIYGVGLFGIMRCRPPDDGAGGCIDGDSRPAVAGLAGAEIRFRKDGGWSAGIEAGYWLATSRTAAAADVDHLTFAAVFRWRPPRGRALGQGGFGANAF